MVGRMQQVLLSIVRKWRFRHVRLMGEGVGCNYKSINSKFVASERLLLGNNVHIGPGAMVDATGGVGIGDGTVIAPEVWIYSRTHNFNESVEALPFDNVVLAKEVQIGKYVWIGARAIILPGVRIGDGAIIGAGAVVAKNIPDCAVAVGNPAQVVKYRDKSRFSELVNSPRPFVYEKFGHKKIVKPAS